MLHKPSRLRCGLAAVADPLHSPMWDVARNIDLASGRPVYDDSNRPGDPTKGGDGTKGNSVFSAPSFLGGKNQQQISYNPDTGLFYVPANEWGMEIWNEPIAYKKGAAYLGAGFTIKTINEDYIGALRAGKLAKVAVKSVKVAAKH